MVPLLCAGAAGAEEAYYEFDVSAQPLAQALDQYAAISHRPALFSSKLVAGRTSSTLRGYYPPDVALHLLLEGTGLVAERVAEGPADAFLLREVRPKPASLATARTGVDYGYGALLQAAIWQLLCVNPRLIPDDYRALIRFRVDEAGRLHLAELLGNTGDILRDRDLLATLRQVRVGQSPPSDLQQPLTMIILPVAAGTLSRCAAGASVP